MDNPNWAEVLSANAALWAAIASGATTLVAIAALIFARSAAKAAQEQVILLERQLVLSEPRPIVHLEIQYKMGTGALSKFQIRNVGEEPSFHVEISPVELAAVPPFLLDSHSMIFNRIPLLEAGEPVRLPYVISPVIQNGSYQDQVGQSHPDSKTFFYRLCSAAALQNPQQTREVDVEITKVRVTYLNARGEIVRNAVPAKNES